MELPSCQRGCRQADSLQSSSILNSLKITSTTKRLCLTRSKRYKHQEPLHHASHPGPAKGSAARHGGNKTAKHPKEATSPVELRSIERCNCRPCPSRHLLRKDGSSGKNLKESFLKESSHPGPNKFNQQSQYLHPMKNSLAPSDRPNHLRAPWADLRPRTPAAARASAPPPSR